MYDMCKNPFIYIDVKYVKYVKYVCMYVYIYICVHSFWRYDRTSYGHAKHVITMIWEYHHYNSVLKSVAG
jgi:hypothetical protein